MAQNIIEKLREEAVNRLFATNGFNSVWSTWQGVIHQYASSPTPRQLINLGDHLKDIFIQPIQILVGLKAMYLVEEQIGKLLFAGI